MKNSLQRWEGLENMYLHYRELSPLFQFCSQIFASTKLLGKTEFQFLRSLLNLRLGNAGDALSWAIDLIHNRGYPWWITSTRP